MDQSTSPATRYRLRGWIDGHERSYLLDEGGVSLGSAETNDVVLAVPGVSRRHARLEQRAGRLELEDQGSRNGSQVNGRQIVRGEVRLGDVISLGPVELVVEEIAAGDAELALLFAPAAPAVASLVVEQTTTNLRQEAPAGRTEVPNLAFPEDHVVGCAPAMVRFYRDMQALSAADLPVLIEGETGVGKESVAQILHRTSERREGPFVAVNCAAIPVELLEAEMFGIADGVATGVRRRSGTFRDADGGTLLLDELGEMPLTVQAKLLRVLQEHEVQPVGGRPVAVDVRMLAASNAGLKERVESGHFRRDLYYRVAGSVLRVPPLRERKEDIPRFVEHFLRHAAAGKTIRGLTVKALEVLCGYPWPGNVRELEHEARRLAFLCPAGQAIDSTMLAAHLSFDLAGRDEPESSESWRLADHVRDAERRAIRRALEQAGGSQRKAAALLAISRNTLARKMRDLALAVRDVGPTPGRPSR